MQKLLARMGNMNNNRPVKDDFLGKSLLGSIYQLHCILLFLCSYTGLSDRPS